MRLAVAPFVLVVLAAACSRESDAPQQPASSPSKPAPAAFGQKLDVKDTTALTDIAKNPGAFKSKTIATQGTVTRVCQERGCWMAIKDESGQATVRMHGHSFFVPTTSSGKHARVQGTVMLTKDGHECDEMEAVGAQLEIDATGVELVD